MSVQSKGKAEAQDQSVVATDISRLKMWLALVRAADAMAGEGVTRATVSQVLGRAMRDSGLEASPSAAGQAFSSMGFRTTVVHGKSGLLLDQSQLDQMAKDMAARVEALTQKAGQYRTDMRRLRRRWRS